MTNLKIIFALITQKNNIITPRNSSNGLIRPYCNFTNSLLESDLLKRITTEEGREGLESHSDFFFSVPLMAFI